MTLTTINTKVMTDDQFMEMFRQLELEKIQRMAAEEEKKAEEKKAELAKKMAELAGVKEHMLRLVQEVENLGGSDDQVKSVQQPQPGDGLCSAVQDLFSVSVSSGGSSCEVPSFEEILREQEDGHGDAYAYLHQQQLEEERVAKKEKEDLELAVEMSIWEQESEKDRAQFELRMEQNKPDLVFAQLVEIYGESICPEMYENTYKEHSHKSARDIVKAVIEFMPNPELYVEDRYEPGSGREAVEYHPCQFFNSSTQEYCPEMIAFYPKWAAKRGFQPPRFCQCCKPKVQDGRKLQQQREKQWRSAEAAHEKTRDFYVKHPTRPRRPFEDGLVTGGRFSDLPEVDA